MVESLLWRFKQIRKDSGNFRCVLDRHGLGKVALCIWLAIWRLAIPGTMGVVIP